MIANSTEERPSSGIHFRFDERKAAAVAAHLLQSAGGRLPYMSLIKLMYFADRSSLGTFGRPLTGDEYFAMKLGPVLSNTLNLIKETPTEGPWATAIRTDGYDAILNAPVGDGPLSEAETELLDRVWVFCKDYSQWALSDLSHTFQEWEAAFARAVAEGEQRRRITPEEILRSIGRPDTIDDVRQEAIEDAFLTELLGK